MSKETINSIIISEIPKIVRTNLSYAIDVLVKVENPDIASLIEDNENIFLSYHWYNEDKTVFIWDNERFKLKRDISDDYLTSLPINIPKQSGVFYLQIDIVEEGVQWFCGSGLMQSNLCKVEVEKYNQKREKDYRKIIGKDIILYGEKKFVKDFEMFFYELTISACFYEDALPDINSEESLIILCSFNCEKLQMNLEAIGMDYGKKFIYASDIINYIDKIDNELLYKNRKVIVFGTGICAEELITSHPLMDVSYFIDSDYSFYKEEYLGKPVKQPEVICDESLNDILVIIAAHDHFEQTALLQSMGFVYGTEFVIYNPESGVLETGKRIASEILTSVIKAEPECDRVCPRLFHCVRVGSHGYTKPCCQTVSNVFNGSLLSADFNDIMNSMCSRVFRLSALNGTYALCNRVCTYIGGGTGCTVADNRELPDEYKTVKHSVNRLFEFVPGYDNVCNLACATCRKSLFVKNTPKDSIRIEKIEKIVMNEIMNITDVYYVSSSGDPFFTYANMISNPPSSAHLLLSTNGMLFNEKGWEMIKGKYKSIQVNVSIDAACADTYNKIREGNWNNLLCNLKFISELRKNNELVHYCISFVVQKDNFREMEDFIKMGFDLGVDRVWFQVIIDKGLSATGCDANVANNRNPYHEEYKKVISSHLFEDSRVVLKRSESRLNYKPISEIEVQPSIH
ncbi:MAG: hypothetical protein FWD38_00705 [Oscillospiraceae bacterium]|nr:hypothetical protein [Oscillospiraceae bacterium]